MASSTIHSYLMKSSDGSTWAKFLDIKDYPDLIGDPNQLQATTLTDDQHWYVPGVKDNEGILNFTANYTNTDFNTVKSAEGTEAYFAVWFGDTSGSPSGVDGKFSFKGYPFVKLSGKGVDEVREMVVGIVPTTAITFATGS